VLSKKLLLLQLVILFFIGCSKKQIKQAENVNAFDISLFQAKLIDIPLLLAIEPVLSEISDNSFVFYSKDNLKDIINFYEIEMEFLGWREVAKFESFEPLLMFEKPNKRSVISIRPEKARNKVVIFW